MDIFLNAINWIIKLLKTARDDKKAGLEIRKLQGEISAFERRIHPATFEDVQKYDPKVHALGRDDLRK